MTALVLISMPLAGCPESGDSAAPGKLPGVPSDIQACFRDGPVAVPNKALTVSDVESLWKEDRIRLVVSQKCGKRFQSWYNSLRRGWK